MKKSFIKKVLDNIKLFIHEIKLVFVFIGDFFQNIIHIKFFSYIFSKMPLVYFNV